MSATDELRRLLDERGVEWWGSRYGEQVVFQVGEVKWFANDGCRDGMLELSTILITPEQAIAATLGDDGVELSYDGVTAESIRMAIERLRQTVLDAFASESISILVEGNAIMRAIDDVEAATLVSVDKGEPQGTDGNLDQSQIDWLRYMPNGWDGTPPKLGGGECEAIHDKSYYKGIHGYCEGLKCSNCGEPLFSEFKSCPWCGMTIRKAVER
jgi:hypothetical protein